ncbi:MAG: M48 family metalloprotease [Gammaproteobacteria bacterium]|nr:M48 family metalloprotease [Gammaproteobacteria bacterium]
MSLAKALGAFVIGCALAAPATAQLKLPDIGDVSRGTFNNQDERQLADAFLREIQRHLTLVKDPEIIRYVRRVGARLAASSEDSSQSFRFYAIAENTINAFAGPGGIIGVNTGLLLAARTESEFAAVVAHEIAHITQKHLARAIESADKFSLPALAGIFAALVLASQNAQAGQAALTGIVASQAQRSIDFTRSNEEEADRVGIDILARAGFDPRAVPEFFQELQRANRFYPEPPEFLSTHPVTAKRVSDSQARAEQYPYRQYADSLEFLLVRAKLQAVAPAQAQDAVRRFEKNLKAGQVRNRSAAKYGYSVALIRAKRFADAAKVLNELLREDPERINYLSALAHCQVELGNNEKAYRIYRDALRIYPNDLALTPAYAQALFNDNRPEEALRVLQRFKKYQEFTATHYELLARVHSRLGDPFSANVANAESHYLNGDLRSAIHALGTALRDRAPNEQAISRIEARLGLFETEQEQRNQRKR